MNFRMKLSVFWAILFLLLVFISHSATAGTLFLARYNGNTGNNGCNADYASGSVTASTSSGSWPTINTNKKIFGAGSLNMPWWDGKGLKYNAYGNYDNEMCTIEFWLNTSPAFYNSNGKYLFDGKRRYIFNDNISWGTAGHVDAWLDGTQGANTARLVIHIFYERNGKTSSITMMGPPNLLYTNRFVHYVIQWNSSKGWAAVFYQGFLWCNVRQEPWIMKNVPSYFKIGMQSSDCASILIDDLRISDNPLYDDFVGISEKSFDVVENEIGLPMAGDADGDGKINMADFAIMASNWFKSVSNGGKDGDFFQDKVVNLKDLAVFSQNWLTD